MNTKALTIALLSVALLSTSPVGSAFADNPWQKAHPRREQVNNRLANQNRRIHDDVRERELTRARTFRLHNEDRRIRQEERDMASQNGGHITRLEQRTLNQQENAVSRQIGQ